MIKITDESIFEVSDEIAKARISGVFNIYLEDLRVEIEEKQQELYDFLNESQRKIRFDDSIHVLDKAEYLKGYMFGSKFGYRIINVQYENDCKKSPVVTVEDVKHERDSLKTMIEIYGEGFFDRRLMNIGKENLYYFEFAAEKYIKENKSFYGTGIAQGACEVYGIYKQAFAREK